MTEIFKFLLALQIFTCVACSHLSSKEAEDSTAGHLELKKVWVKSTSQIPDKGYRKNVRMTPLVIGNRVIQGNAFDGIVAVDRESGRIVWRINIPGGAEGGVTFIKDRLFFGGNDGKFYSASVATGEIFWKIELRSEILGSPLVDEGIVYILSGNNVLHAIDGVDGHELWIYSRVDNQNFSVRGASSPVLHDGSLIVGFSDGYLVSLNAKNGGLKWEVALNKNKRFRDIDSTPVIDGDFVYVTGYDSHLYCVRHKTGDLVWKLEPGGFGKVLVFNDKLFYSSSKGEVLAIDKKNGNSIWKYKLSEGVATSPGIYKDYLVFGESQGSLRFLNLKDGVSVAHLSPGLGIFSPISIDSEKGEFYFISNSAWLYKIKALWIRGNNETLL